MDEIWQDIEGYEGYQVSNEGQVRSLDRIDRLGRPLKGKILNPFISKSGYQRVILCKNGNTKTFQLHRLVYAAFNGEIPPCMQVNHIDECKTNNRLENLNLMTAKENCNWGTRNERQAIKVSKPVVGYDAEGNAVVVFPSAMEAGRNGYDQSAVSACCRGKRPTHKGLIWKYKDDWDC